MSVAVWQKIRIFPMYPVEIILQEEENNIKSSLGFDPNAKSSPPTYNYTLLITLNFLLSPSLFSPCSKQNRQCQRRTSAKPRPPGKQVWCCRLNQRNLSYNVLNVPTVTQTTWGTLRNITLLKKMKWGIGIWNKINDIQSQPTLSVY